MTRHIIYLCLVFHPDTSASSILFTDLFRRLARERAEVTVLCGFPTKDVADGVLPREEMLDGVRIVRCGLRIDGKRSLATRAISYGSFLAHAGWKLLRTGRHATVVGGTDPPFTSIALWLLCGVGRFDYQAILLDVYPDGLVGLGTLSDSALLTRLWRALNRLSYRRAAGLIVIGRDMAALLHRKYGIQPERVTYIPHWGSHEVESTIPRWGSHEAESIDAGRRGPLLSSRPREDRFVVQYSGNMGLWHDMDALVRAAYLLRQNHCIHFLFIGKGRRRSAAEALAGDLGVCNITWLDFLPRGALRESLRSCDVALISLRSGLAGVAVPSKLYGILASGRAVVGQVPRESEVAYVLQEEGCGIVVEPGDVEGLAAAIEQLAANPALVAEMGTNASRAYRSKYTIDHAVAAFSRIWALE